MVLSNKQAQAYEARWNGMFSALKEYKRLFHHCFPPRVDQGEYIKLSTWVSNQRTAHKSGTLSLDRQIKLNTIGFFSKVKDGSSWISYYNKLVEFYRCHGHCNADTTYFAAGAERGFLKWLQTQRDDHKYGLLRAERKQLLEKLGEPWTSVGTGTIDGSVVATNATGRSTASDQTTTLVQMPAKPPVKRGRPKGTGGKADKKKKPMHDREKHIVLDLISPVVEEGGEDDEEDDIVAANSVYQAVSAYVNKRKDNKRKRILFDTAPRKQSTRRVQGDRHQGNECSLTTVHNAKTPPPNQLQQRIHHRRPGSEHSLLAANGVTAPSKQLQQQIHHSGQPQPKFHGHPGYSMVPYHGAVRPIPFHSFSLPTSNHHHHHMVAPVVESSPAKRQPVWRLAGGTAYTIPSVDSNSPNSSGGMSWGSTPQQLFAFRQPRDPEGRYANEML